MAQYTGIAKSVTSLLLLFNGIGAVYGGSSMILHPDGSGLGMGVQWLQHSPFSNYTIPGIVLLVVNGLFSFLCVLVVWRYERYAAKWVATQGILLGGWLLVQIAMLQLFHTLHAIMGITAVLLLVCARWLHAGRTQTH
jgi:hypothetical protein